VGEPDTQGPSRVIEMWTGETGARDERRSRKKTEERTSARPAVPGDKRAQERTQELQQAQNQQRPAGEARPAAEAAGRAKNQRVRVTSVREDGPVISGDKQGARVSGRTGHRCAPGTSERGGIRGRPIAAGRAYTELAFSGI
jgi:hypothetical protein